jgi:hypothetical protein
VIDSRGGKILTVLTAGGTKFRQTGFPGLPRLRPGAPYKSKSRGALGHMAWVQNVPSSEWVKTDAASKMANATSVETRLPERRQFLPTRCEVHSVPPVPPQVPTTGATLFPAPQTRSSSQYSAHGIPPSE